MLSCDYRIASVDFLGLSLRKSTLDARAARRYESP